MKKSILISGAFLLMSLGLRAQNNSSYWLNSTPIQGTYNAAFGTFTLYDNLSSGIANSAFGYEALTSNTTGDYNVATGYQALYDNTTGSNNTASGRNALTFNTTGSSNASFGSRTLYLNSTGNFNTAVGYEALNNNTSGYNNTALGYLALTNNSTGYLNNGLGMYANVSTGNQDLSSSIGAFAVSNLSKKIKIGASTNTVVEGQVPYSVPSDGRFKTNVRETDVIGLEFIKRLRPVVYNFDTKKFQEFLTQNMPDSIQKMYLEQDFSSSTAVRQSGFIAQEVEEAAKESGYNFNGVHTPMNENDNYSIAYSQFVIPLVKGMQEQQVMIEELQKEILELKNNTPLPTQQSTQDQENVTIENCLIFPNPNKGIFTVVLNEMETGTLIILNEKGEIVKTIQLTKGISKYTVDLTHQAKGNYLVSVLSGDAVVSKKIILQ